MPKVIAFDSFVRNQNLFDGDLNLRAPPEANSRYATGKVWHGNQMDRCT